MQSNKGFIGVGALIVIILSLVVVGGGAYYIGQQNAAPTQQTTYPDISTTQQPQQQQTTAAPAKTVTNPPAPQPVTKPVQTNTANTTSDDLSLLQARACDSTSTDSHL